MSYPRCYVVHAVAPDGVNARQANDRVNAYIEDAGRGLAVFHDHFTGTPHGGLVVLEVRNEAERARLDDLGPLDGWDVDVHALTFALTGLGFLAQTELTIEGYGRTSVAALQRDEAPDPRFWWRRRRGRRAEGDLDRG